MAETGFAEVDAMPDAACRLRIEDSVESPPFAFAGDLVVVVRTPRSGDFVTVEVGRILDCRFPPSSPGEVICAPSPAPWVANGWSGEVRSGEDVYFELGGRMYRLTLEGTDETRCRPPWGCYQFRLERVLFESGPATVA